MSNKNDAVGPRQTPPRLPVVGMADMQRGWWPGVSTRCASCGGRLWLTPPDAFPGRVSCLLCEREVAEVLDAIRPIVRGADIPHPKRGRPPKGASPRPMTPRPLRPCVECGVLRRVTRARPRCRPCATADQIAGTGKQAAILTALRAAGRPLKSREIAEALGINPCNVRQLIRSVRRRGYPVLTVGKGYRLDGAA